MIWSAPGWLWGLLALPVLGLLLAWLAARHRRRLAAALAPRVLQRALPPAVRARRGLRDGFLLAGLAGLLLALADPQWGERVITIEQRGVDIALVLDLSRSMDARDVEPSRLEWARREVLDLIELAPDDRLGLVVFAGLSLPRMPLTHDHEILRLLLDEVDSNTFQVQGSAVDEAIRDALHMLEGSRPGAGRAILILSDGEFHRPAEALTAAREAAAVGVPIYALGIGREAAPIPLRDGGWLTDVRGRTVLTEPSAEVLTEMARITGGAYVASVPSTDDTHRLLSEMRRRLPAAETGSVQRRVTESAYQVPLGLGLLLLLGAAWLGDGRRRLGGAAAVLALGLALPGAAQASSVAEGDALYRSGRYVEAVEVFTALSLQRPDDPDLLGRLAAARLRAGDAEGAARAFDAQSQRSGRPDDLFNSGNAHYHAGRLEEALARYEAVLARDPGHAGAAHNREVLLQELEARRQAPPPPPPDQGEGEGDDAPRDPSDGEGGSGGEGGAPDESPEQGEGEQEGSDGAQDEEGGPGHDEVAEGEGEGQQREGSGATGGNPLDDGLRDAPDERGELPNLGEVRDVQDGADVPVRGEAQAEGGPMTPAQAERVLEGVEEGRPRAVVPGRPIEERPW